MRLILRRLPCTLRLALQRNVWPNFVYLDGMSDACRQRAFTDFMRPVTGGPSAISGHTYSPPFEPPWIAFPDYPMFSMGFRMGGGETYMRAFMGWYSAANTDERAEFQKAHPEPDRYQGYYETIDDLIPRKLTK